MAATTHTAVVGDGCVSVKLICVGADVVSSSRQLVTQLVAEVVDRVITITGLSAVASEVVADVHVLSFVEGNDPAALAVQSELPRLVSISCKVPPVNNSILRQRFSTGKK